MNDVSSQHRKNAMVFSSRAFLRSAALNTLLVVASGWFPCLPSAQAQSAKPEAGESKLVSRQSSVAQRYRKLEELLLRLADMEAAENPEREALLRRAAKMSREKFVLDKLSKATDSIRSQEYKRAIENQDSANRELRLILKLLQSEDRAKRIREEKEYYQKLMADLKRNLNNQRSARARNENGADLQDVKRQQKSVTEQSESLQQKLAEQNASLEENDDSGERGDESNRQNESDSDDSSPQNESDNKESNSDSKAKSDSKNDQSSDNKENEGEENEGKDSDPSSMENSENSDSESSKDKSDKPKEDQDQKSGDPKSEQDSSKQSESQQSESKSGESQQSQSESQQSESQQSESQQSESQQSESQQSQSQQSQSQQSQSEQQSSQPQSSQPQSTEQQIEKKLQQAIENMKRAEEELEKAQRNKALEQQEQAEEQLRKAIEQLEKILRQLREEEMERELARLESRVRKMVAMQQRVLDDTKKLSETPKSQRGRGTDLAAGKLALEQKKISVEADRAMLILREEGSSVAFPEVMTQIKSDSSSVADLLARTRIDGLSQGIQQDILDALEEMIDALEKAQRDLEQQKKEQKPGQSAPSQQGEKPLVEALAELKLIRTMESRVQKTTKRYSKRLELGESSEADIEPLLKDLAARQLRIYKITRDLVTKRNQ